MDDERAMQLLRDLGTGVLAHASCHPCRCSAADALDELGVLGDVLREHELDDPRLWCTEQAQEWAHRGGAAGAGPQPA